MTDQGYPPRQPEYPGRGRSRTSQEPRRTGWQVIDAFDDGADTDSDLPPWAVPGGIEPLRPARRPPRAPEPGQLDEPGPPAEPEPEEPPRIARRQRRSRAAATRRRKSKRRLVTWGGTAIVILILVGLGFILFQSPAPKSPYVTALQKGEFKAVPDACKIVGATALHQIMGETPKVTQPQNDAALSQCVFTVDAQPTFRVLQLNVQAYNASLTVPVGDGSATANAKYTIAAQRRLLAHPSKHTPAPAATITPVSGLGDEAFSAVQVFHTKSVVELVTVLARYRNVLVEAIFQGQASGGFGPVTVSELRSGALAAARTAVTQVKSEPTV